MTARLEGDVQVTTTTGYDIRTDAIDARFDTLFAETPGPGHRHRASPARWMRAA